MTDETGPLDGKPEVDTEGGGGGGIAKRSSSCLERVLAAGTTVGNEKPAPRNP